MTIASFGRGACPVTDGTICVASDHPYGGPGSASENDHVPAMTIIWLAAE